MTHLRVVWTRYALQISLLVVVVGLFAVIAPDFVGENALFAVLERLVPLGIITAGIAVTMIVGELDLSIASLAAVSGAGVIVFGDSGLGLVPLILGATLFGAVVGAVQGWAVARLGISSLVLTVATLILFRGAASLVTDGVPVSLANYTMTDPLLQRSWVFSPLAVTALVVVLVLGLYLSRTRPGRALYAIGGGRAEAAAAGVPVRKTLVIAFAISGGCGALAGAMSSLRSGSATPDGFGSMLLLGVAAALVGGIKLSGGRGDMVNVLLGVFITSTLASGLSSMGVKSYVSELLTGVLLLAVIALEAALLWAARGRQRQKDRNDSLGLTPRAPRSSSSRESVGARAAL